MYQMFGALGEHGKNVSFSEDRAQAILRQYLNAITSGNPQLLLDLKRSLNDLNSNQPLIPLPKVPTGGGGGRVSNGGGGNSGGGAGIESFPPWMTLQQYEANKPELGFRLESRSSKGRK
ncbi:hypothetical protein MRY87_11855 [bacterium]|nr:hypothetical protein [bacterium]